MSDYTPTSEDIRYSYATDKRDEPGFDRWLAEVKAQAWEEGFRDGDRDWLPGDELLLSNPYRKGEQS